jgi:hypothetical protein
VRLLISPYHLTSREPAAMAALLLAESAVTLLPLPPEGVERDEVRLALRRHPRYARLLESWRWSFPLWQAGVLASLDDRADAIEGVRGAAARIQAEVRWAGLRGFLHRELFAAPVAEGDDEARAGGPAGDDPDLFAADLLKGGPDPGISVPVGAGLDAFAAERGLVAVRAGASRSAVGGGPASPTLAQRAEARLGQTLAACVLPVLTQASGDLLLEARDELAEVLGVLRGAWRAAESGGGGEEAALRAAAAGFAEQFEAWVEPLRGHDDGSGRQVLDGYVRLTLRRVPVDAVLRGAAVAVRAIRPERAAAPDEPAEAASVLTLVVEATPVRPGGVPAASPMNHERSAR